MSWDYLKNIDPEPEKEVTWGDYGKAAAGTAVGIGAGSAGLMRQMFEAGQNENAAKLFRGLQGAARNLGEDIEGSMTEEGRARNAAGVTTEKFWEHPVSSIALKAVGMSPYLLAAALPGALVGEGVAAMAATGAAGGWLAAGDVADEITKKPDKMSDADLRATSPLYAGFRDDGLEEKDARQQLNQIMVGAKPALAFILGAGTGVLGPAGNVVRGLGRGAVGEAVEAGAKAGASKGSNFLGQHGIKAAAAEGGATEFAEEGYGAYAAQKSEIEGGLRKDYDAKEAFDRALTGAVLGTGFGAVSGIGAGRGKGKEKADEIRAAEEQRRGEEETGVQPPAGQGQVAVPEKGGPAKAAATAAKKGVEVVEPGAPNAAEALAIGDKQQQVQPKAAPVEPPVPAPPQPTAPPVEAAQPAAAPPQATPPVPTTPAAQAPQAPSAPPQGPAEVTPEVTMEMAKRGFTSEEVAQLTPEQRQQILATPVSQETRSLPTEVTPPAQVATAPVSTPPEVAPTGQVPTAPEKPVTSENIPAIPAAPAEKPVPAAVEGEATQPAKRNRKGPVVQAATAKRAEHAKTIYDAHRESLGETFGDKPVKREAREAMAKKIDAILAKAAEHGLVPRESLPDDVRVEKAGQTPEQKHQRAMSIPERASGDEMSAHVIHLRELIGVRNALRGQKFGPKSEERARVNDFLAEYNVGEKGLALLAERRLVEGRRRKAVRGSGIAGAATKVTKGSEDLPGSEVRNVTEELRKQYEQPGVGPAGAAILEKSKKPVAETSRKAEPSAPAEVATAPKIPDKSDASTEVPAAPPAVKVAEIKAKAKAEPKVAASPQLLQAADKHLENLNNLRKDVKNPVQKARLDQAIKTFNEQTSEALKTGEWSAVQKAMADLGVKVPKAKAEPKPKITEGTKPEPTETVATEQQEEKTEHPHIPDLSKGERYIAHEMSAEHLADPNIHPHAREVNTLRRWVNSLSDADYNKLRDAGIYGFPQSLGDTQEPGRLLESFQRLLRGDKEVMILPGDYSATINKTEKALDAGKAKPEAEEKVTPEVTEKPEAKPEPKAKKQSVDMETKGILKGLGYTELDIRKMSFEEANEKADDGIPKGEVTPEVTEASVPEGLTASQAKAFLKLDPEQQQKVRDALEERPATSKMGGINSLEDLMDSGSEVGVGRTWLTPLHKAVDEYGHDDRALAATFKTGDVLRNLDIEHLSELPKYLQGFTMRRLAELVDHIPVYVANSQLMLDANPNDKNAPQGYYQPGYGKVPGHIVIRSDIVLDNKKWAHTVIHEALHAALRHRLESSKEFRSRVSSLMDELQAQVTDKEGKATINYAMRDVHEFVSEALSNPDLQEIMAKLTISDATAKALNLKPQHKLSIWGAFVQKVREKLGLPPGANNFLDAALRTITPELEGSRQDAIKSGTYTPQTKPQASRLMDIDKLRDAAVGKAVDTSTNAGDKLFLAKNKISSLYMLARRAQKYWDASNPLNRLFEARAFMERAKDVILEKYGGLKATIAIAKAERQHPEAMAKAKAVLFDASLHDVNLEGSNDHLGKDKMMGVQAKNEIAALQKAWADPAINPVRQTIRDAVKFYRDIHNAVSRETINNVLAESNIHDPALAERIHTSGLTEEDQKTWAGTKLVSALDQVQGLKRRQGWYVPFRRYGEFSTTANHELSVPANATKINDNTLQFVAPNGKNMAARALTKAYLRSNSHTPQGNKLTPVQVQKVWVDKNNPTKLMEGTEPDAVIGYRVAMQTQHTEMHETLAEAHKSRADLEQAGLVGARAHSRDDAYSNDHNIQGAMGTILRSLEKQQRFIDADSTQKAAMREMFHDLTLGLSGTTSIKNSMRQRRNVAGMSHDLGRVTGDYARMTANHLAKLQHRPKIDAILKEMRDYSKAHENHKDSIRRDQVYKEFVDRIYGSSAAKAEEHKAGPVTRLLQMSRLSRLAGPSFHIINAHEPWTTSLPVLGGDHGFGAAMRQLTEAYNYIGGRAAVASGLKDTAKAYTNDSGFTDYVKLFKDTIGQSKIAGPDKIGRMQAVIDYMNDRNLYSNASIFEVGKFANPEGNIAGRALDRADLMANQVGSAIESINRTVTGLSAYNLEYKKNGGNHEAAMHYAYSKAHETMGDYSHWNAAPIFNSKLGRVALQFKKFGHKTYYLLGSTMGRALQGDPAAMKQFAGLMVTHGLVAGALGMPTEPFKVALLAANFVGATGFTPDDYDYAVRQLAARVAGQKGGEIISRGLYRGVGIEVSGRMGLDTLLTHGAPKSQKDADIKSWLFDTMAGAPAGYLLDQVKAAQAAFKGDWATAVEKASPLRTVGDITKAAVGLAGDKKGPSGKTTQEQFTPWQAAVRAAGFQPSGPAEMGALRGTIARQSKKLSADRAELIGDWIDASGAKKVAAQRAVQEFNAGRPKNEQITSKDLSSAARRRETEETKTKHGTTTTKRIKAIQDTAEGVFNP